MTENMMDVQDWQQEADFETRQVVSTVTPAENGALPRFCPFVVRVYSRFYGLMLENSFENRLQAMGWGATSCGAHFYHDYYEVTDGTGMLVATGGHAYAVHEAIITLRTFRDCCREVIAGWECREKGFRVLVDKGLIVPADNHLDHEAGYWFLTERFRKLGRYLVKRHWW